MPTDTAMPYQECNCLALRQAARHVTQFYDQCLAPAGLRATQVSILAKLKRSGPLTINALARELVMDRTTLGRTMLPLERDGLIAIKDGTLDRRSKELHLTKAGAERHRVAGRLWSEAQMQFERDSSRSRQENPQRQIGSRRALPGITETWHPIQHFRSAHRRPAGEGVT